MSEAKQAPSSSSSVWWIIFLGAWLLGLGIWINTDPWLVRSATRLAIYAGAIVICFIPPVRRLLCSLGKLLDRRGRVATPALFLAMSLLALVILYATAVQSHRKFSPVMHDEYSYLLQAQMLARGHLSMPAHPLGDFFDTFYVITDRAYASQYFPGAALMFVPGVWLGLSSWVMPLVIASAAAGMLFLVVRELFDGLSGFAAVFIVCGILGYRFLSLVPIAQMPTLLLGLFAFYACLRWLATRGLRWIVVCGAAMGWLVITRPLDAVVYALPIGVLIVVDLIRTRASFCLWRRVVILGLLAMTPFLALQLMLNHRVTGHWLQTPFAYYAARDLPGTQIGFHMFDGSLRPASSLQTKQAFYMKNVRPMLAKHTPSHVIDNWIRNRAKTTAGEMVGDTLLFLPVPAGLLLMRDPRRWAVVSVLPLWCVLYSFYVFHYAHYYVAVVPSVMILTFAGFESISRLMPRTREAVLCLRAVLPAVVSVLVMPQFKSDVMDQFVNNGVEEGVRATLSQIAEPAVVLFDWSGDVIPEWEAVYNIDAAWPDDCRVIRAHDLGERNIELYRYYADHQPQRIVYRYDASTGALTKLGKVTDLARP